MIRRTINTSSEQLHRDLCVIYPKSVKCEHVFRDFENFWDLPPPSTASRSDKEAKHGPNQKREISRKIQTKSKNQIGTLHAISFGGHVNPKRTVGDVLENFVGAPAHSSRNLQLEDIIKGEALGRRPPRKKTHNFGPKSMVFGQESCPHGGY